jgi:hypothetical protein
MNEILRFCWNQYTYTKVNESLSTVRKRKSEIKHLEKTCEQGDQMRSGKMPNMYPNPFLVKNNA